MFSLAEFLGRIRMPAVMGIVNATGDSFSEGTASAPETAAERAFRLLDDGADLLDLGGESTRPGAAPVTEEEELRRILPALLEIKRRRPDAVCAIDTRHGKVAAAALEAGAEIINDVAMLHVAPEIADAVARHGAGLILCHSRGTPENMNSPVCLNYPRGVAETVAEELAAAEKAAVAAGVKAADILLDPGFGFAKTPEQNWSLAGHLAAVAPREKLLVGVSRKRFLGELTANPAAADRDFETLALELALAPRCAVIRTHNVKKLVRALAVAGRLDKAKTA